MELKHKTVFITGSSSGIGAACAKKFASLGARLLLCARRIKPLEALRAEIIKEYGVEIFIFPLDIRSYDQVCEQLNSLPSNWRDIDILVNNAGLAAGFSNMQDSDIDDWDSMIDTNLKGLLYVTKQILPNMIAKNCGHIINIGSIAGHEVYPRGAVYCATKYAVNALTKGLRMDLFGTKIRVSSVDPGAVETNFSLVRFKGDKERAAAVYQGMEALNADDVADAVIYCATRPPHVNISEIILTSVDQASATMFSRK